MAGGAAPQGQAIRTQTVSTGTAQLASELAAAAQDGELESELRELDDENLQRLREYLNQHDRVSRLKGREQLVTYPKDR